MDTRSILEAVKKEKMTVDEAVLALKTEPFADLGYAKVDLHRKLRKGVSEVIYGEGKTAEQITGILSGMKAHGQERVIVTRLSREKADEISKNHAISYHREARLALLGGMPELDGMGSIVVAAAGTSDIPVAEEAALTAEVTLGIRF